MSLQSSVETLFRWSEDGGGRNWVCNWSNCRGNREVAVEHDLQVGGNVRGIPEQVRRAGKHRHRHEHQHQPQPQHQHHHHHLHFWNNTSRI